MEIYTSARESGPSKEEKMMEKDSTWWFDILWVLVTLTKLVTQDVLFVKHTGH